MAIQVQELKAWLDNLQDEEVVAIDDGGLILVVVDDPASFIEIGGIPED